jgi:hypothetical protein
MVLLPLSKNEDFEYNVLKEKHYIPTLPPFFCFGTEFAPSASTTNHLYPL